MADALLTTYDAAIRAATRSAGDLDRIALALDPQPTTFAALRAIAPLSAADTPGSTTILSGRSTTSSGPGSVEQDLRRRGVNEPTLLARAADIDDATQDLTTAATTPSQRRAAAHRVTLRAAESPSTRHQHPARHAAKDKPPYTSSKTPLPKLVPINHPIRHRPATHHRQTP